MSGHLYCSDLPLIIFFLLLSFTQQEPLCYYFSRVQEKRWGRDSFLGNNLKILIVILPEPRTEKLIQVEAGKDGRFGSCFVCVWRWGDGGQLVALLPPLLLLFPNLFLACARACLSAWCLLSCISIWEFVGRQKRGGEGERVCKQG